MIKKLSLKFVLVFLVLVVSVIITSSCYADLSTTVKEVPFTLEDVYSSSNFEHYWQDVAPDFDFYGNDYKLLVYYRAYDNIYIFKFLYGNHADIASTNITPAGYIYYFDSSGAQLKVNYYTGQVNGDGSIRYILLNNSTDKLSDSIPDGSSYDCQLANLTNFEIKYNNEAFYEPQLLSVDVTHEFQSDTSAKVNFVINNAPEGAYLQYSLTGVKISTDLDAPVQLRNPITYTPRSNKFSCKGKY